MSAMTDEPLEEQPLPVRATNADWLKKAQSGSIVIGILLLAAAHVAAFGLSLLLATFTGLGVLLWPFYVGVAQLVYVVPLVLWMKTRAGPRTVKGVQIGALITALLNAACFGLGIAGI